MFDGLWKSKFYSKSKTAIKTTRVRLETIKKKRGAVNRYLKKDIADLLRNGLDINAYGRAEGLLAEQNMTSCYEFIDQFCGCISSHLVTMQKQSECPEESLESVASLMYAAARFADLPELRELRTLFKEKYGNFLDSYVNKEFMERLKSKPSSKDLKIQLMRDIAVELSMDWNSKALEQKLFDPNPPNQGNENDERKPRTYKETERNDKGLNSYARKDIKEYLDRLSGSSSSEDEVTILRKNDRADKYGMAKQSSSSSSSPSDEETTHKQPSLYRNVPPPYIESKTETHEGGDGADSTQDKPRPKSVRQRKLKPPPGREPGYSSRVPHEVDEEEKMMDKLLMHYSKKKSPYEMEKVKGSLKPPHSLEKARDDEESDRHAPTRASSLPLEPTTPATETTESGRGHCRSSSLQPEMLAGHVHPNLPDCDDLAARIAALKRE